MEEEDIEAEKEAERYIIKRFINSVALQSLHVVTAQPLGSILEAKPLRQGQKTRILGRQSQSCSHLYIYQVVGCYYPSAVTHIYYLYEERQEDAATFPIHAIMISGPYGVLKGQALHCSLQSAEADLRFFFFFLVGGWQLM
jgi:hypothetical protein